MTKNLEMVRETQVLKAFSLQSSGMSLEDSCKKVGIHERTYSRWAERALAGVEEAIHDTKAAVSAAVVQAYPEAIAKVIDIATGPSTEDNPIYPSVRLQAFDRLNNMVSKITDSQDPESSKAEERYLSSSPRWLEGPKTITVEMRDGTKVKVSSPSEPIEGEVTVVNPSDQSPSESSPKSLTDSKSS
jgi:hypothetical protein